MRLDKPAGEPTADAITVLPMKVGRVVTPAMTAELVDRARARSMSRDESDRILAELASYAAAGSADHRGLLVQLTYELPFARTAISRVLFDANDAEDALQETMLSISRSIHRFEQRSSFTTWATAIARNKATDVLRRRSANDRREAAQVGPLWSEQERFSSQLATQVDVERVVALLPQKLGQVVRLRDVEQHTYQEIADVLGIKLNTVRSRLARGRALAAASMEGGR